MRPETDPKKIKRKVYMSYFQDGLWDIFLGLFLLGWGFTVWFDLLWLPGAIFVGFFWLVLGLKKKVTYPRIGHATPTEQRNKTLKIAIAGVVVLVAVVVLLPIVNRGEVQFLRNYFEFLFGSMIAIAVALIGYWWRIYRWYLYAGMFFLFFVFNQWSNLSFSLSFIMPGGIFTLCGLNILYRFLRRYPVVPEEDNHESR
ncbi:hypothetical protein ACFLXC_03850 [Chloroflexota bacterium]